jgi:hypothetical protein
MLPVARRFISGVQIPQPTEANMKRIFTYAVIIILILSSPVYTLNAEDSQTVRIIENINNTLERIEDIYGVPINDPQGLLSPSDGLIFLDTIERTFRMFGSDIMNGIVNYYDSIGLSFRFELRIPQYFEHLNSGVMLRNSREVIIYLYSFPLYDNELSINGISTKTISHEIGHLLFDILEDIYGINELKREWLFLNGDVSYTQNYRLEWRSLYSTIFAYDYGMSHYYEDAATIVEHLISYPIETFERLISGGNTRLMFKTIFLLRMIDEYIANIDTSPGFSVYSVLTSRTDDDPRLLARPWLMFVSSWALDEVNEAVWNGVIPMDKLYDFQEPITRQDYVFLIVDNILNMIGSTAEDVFHSFGYPSDPRFFLDTIDPRISVAVLYEIVDASGYFFYPNAFLTREMASTMLFRTARTFLHYTTADPCEFDDFYTVSLWARDSVMFVVQHDIMRGNNNMFMPRLTYTREQAFITLNRYFTNFMQMDYY